MELQVETEARPFRELQRFYYNARVAVIHLYSWFCLFILCWKSGDFAWIARGIFLTLFQTSHRSRRCINNDLSLRQCVWRQRASLKAHTDAVATSQILQGGEENDMIWTVLLLVHALLLFFILTHRTRWVLSGSISLNRSNKSSLDPSCSVARKL